MILGFESQNWRLDSEQTPTPQHTTSEKLFDRSCFCKRDSGVRFAHVEEPVNDGGRDVDQG